VPTLAIITADGSWRAGIGDPTIWGWAVTAGYALATAISLRAWRVEMRAARADGALRPWFWLAIAAMLAALGINKQLDLQSLVTVIGKRVAIEGGWYERRRAVQVAFILVCAAMAGGAMWVVARRLRGSWARYRQPTLGAAGLAVFVLVRAASFHHIDDALFHLPIVEGFVNRGLEGGSIAFLGWCAWMAAAREAPEAR
jgi:hypothetical protein